MAEGTIIRALSGFYDVEEDGRLCRCRAKGRFRHDGSGTPGRAGGHDHGALPGGVIHSRLPDPGSFKVTLTYMIHYNKK